MAVRMADALVVAVMVAVGMGAGMVAVGMEEAAPAVVTAEEAMAAVMVEVEMAAVAMVEEPVVVMVVVVMVEDKGAEATAAVATEAEEMVGAETVVEKQSLCTHELHVDSVPSWSREAQWSSSCQFVQGHSQKQRGQPSLG